MKATCGHKGRKACYSDGLCWSCHDRQRRGLTFGLDRVEEERRVREANSAMLRATYATAFANGEQGAQR